MYVCTYCVSATYFHFDDPSGQRLIIVAVNDDFRRSLGVEKARRDGVRIVELQLLVLDRIFRREEEKPDQTYISGGNSMVRQR